MLFARNKNPEPFDLAALPPLDLAAGPVSVSIHHLANDEHTNAFIDIFQKLMRDNSDLLARYMITAIEAEHPIESPPLAGASPIPMSTITADPRAAARCLYFSDNGEVLLHLAHGADTRKLLIAFDDPYFTFR